MKLKSLSIPDVYLIEPKIHLDDRGFFFESFNQKEFEKLINKKVNFVQDNHSKSTKGVLRGLHFQNPRSQGKLIRVVHGEIFDVAVDIRKESKTFGKWVGEYLSEENKRQLWVPEGFAHGFLVTSNTAEILYKVTDYYFPEYEYSILWSDPAISIRWPIDSSPNMSLKDKNGKLLSELDLVTFSSDFLC